MIRKDIKVLKDGSTKTYIRIMEGYRPAPGQPPKQRTLKSFGYLEDQTDPEAFMREVEAFDTDPSNREQISSNKMYSGQNRRLNYGYKYLKSVYNALGIADFIKNNAYRIKKGSQEYVLEEILDPETGEREAAGKNTIRSVNLEKAENDALFDGYFCLITSEMEYDAQKIREVYSGLWRIEQSFRIMKSDLLARPVFVSTKEHIRAHFLICFVALLMIRLVQHAMGKDALSVERLARALNAATCKVKRGGIVELDDVGGCMAFVKRENKKDELVDTLTFSVEDEIAKDYKLIQKSFGTDFYEAEAKQETFSRFLKKINYMA